MSATDTTSNSRSDRIGYDVPVLRALLAWLATIGLCIGGALGIAAILGTSLGQTSIRLAASGVLWGFLGLWAVSSTSLLQRSSVWLAVSVLGVLASIVGAALGLWGIWSDTPLGDTATRILTIAVLIAAATGLTGFLVTQQRGEDPLAIRGLMLATLAIAWTLAIALVIDIISATGSTTINGTSTSSASQVLFGGVSFVRFVGVTALLTVLGSLLLPVLRRAHPAFRGGPPTNSP